MLSSFGTSVKEFFEENPEIRAHFREFYKERYGTHEQEPERQLEQNLEIEQSLDRIAHVIDALACVAVPDVHPSAPHMLHFSL